MTDVMLVEDDQQDAELVQRAIRRLDQKLSLNVSRDGEAALKLIGAIESLPRVIFLDLKLPKVGGIEVLKALRQESKTKFLPIVVLTSSDEPSDVLACYRAGVNSYIRKPIDFDEFLKQVEGAIRYWLNTNVSCDHTQG